MTPKRKTKKNLDTNPYWQRSFDAAEQSLRRCPVTADAWLGTWSAFVSKTRESNPELGEWTYYSSVDLHKGGPLDLTPSYHRGVLSRIGFAKVLGSFLSALSEDTCSQARPIVHFHFLRNPNVGKTVYLPTSYAHANARLFRSL